ncbi:MAG TPA: hypothetical protein VJB57_04350 [Dehalococcoidia bacterium]|nr:hypothetical protein [Dehalococcoidia bacterium]
MDQKFDAPADGSPIESTSEVTPGKPRSNWEWHLGHPMPKVFTPENLIAWYEEHEKVCACIKMPDKLREK